MYGCSASFWKGDKHTAGGRAEKGKVGGHVESIEHSSKQDAFLSLLVECPGGEVHGCRAPFWKGNLQRKLGVWTRGDFLRPRWRIGWVWLCPLDQKSRR